MVSLNRGSCIFINVNQRGIFFSWSTYNIAVFVRGLRVLVVIVRRNGGRRLFVDAIVRGFFVERWTGMSQLSVIISVNVICSISVLFCPNFPVLSVDGFSLYFRTSSSNPLPQQPAKNRESELLSGPERHSSCDSEQ